jgi:isopentenyldiphosphate isomerase
MNAPRPSSSNDTHRRSPGLPSAPENEVTSMSWCRTPSFERSHQSTDFAVKAPFGTWLFTIERRLLIDRRRAEKRRRDRTETQDHDSATEFDAC